MKLANIYPFAALAAVVLATAACDEVTDPVYKAPDAADFTLNVPPLQDQYYELTENGTFEIVACGQPDYGFSAITQYRAEVSLTEDFAKFETLTPTGTGTNSRMTLKDSDLATAMCVLHGVTSDEDYVDQGIEKIYFRGVAFINGIDDSYVTTSNVVTLNKVQGYFAIPQPDYIFCIGNYVGDWIGPEAANADALRPYRLTETEIGNNVFYNEGIDFGENAPIFRFYPNLAGWDKPADWTAGAGKNAYFSIGSVGGNDDDNPVPQPDFVAGSTMTIGVTDTKDSFSFPNFNGTVEMTVDLRDPATAAATYVAK